MRAARWVLVAALGAGGCGSEGEGPGAPAAQGVRLLLDLPDDGAVPQLGAGPFPSDAHRGADALALPGLERWAPNRPALFGAHLARLGGFGLRPAVYLPAAGALDPASIPAHTEAAGDALVVLELDEGAPAASRVLPFDWRWDGEQLAILGSPTPGTVLREGTRHAVVVREAVQDAEGHPVAADAGLARLAGEGALPAPFAELRGALRATREALGLEPPEIRGFTAFTTQEARATLLAARTALETDPAIPRPRLTFDDPGLVFAGAARLDALLGVATRDAAGGERWGWSNPTGVAHEHVAVVATGSLTAPRFRRDDSGDEGPDDETFDVDPATGVPRVVEAAARLPITVALPSGSAPAAGWPVAIIGHGLGASRHAVVTFLEPLTAAGFAVVALDFAGHGSRFRDVDEKNNTADVIPGFTGDAALRDGFGDVTGLGTTLALVEGLLNLSAVRDSVRQSVLDVSSLVVALRDPALDLAPLTGAAGAPRLDVTRLAYLGESYGTIVGGVLMGVEPHVPFYVLNVAGAGILDLEVANSPVMGTMLLPLARTVYGYAGRFDRFHPLVGLSQALLEPADPLGWAPAVLRDRGSVAGAPLGPRHVLLIEAVGDEIMPNHGTDALARALGLALLEPHLTAPVAVTVPSPASANLDGQTAVMVQYSPATHGANWSSEEGTLQFLPGFPAEGEDPFPRLPAAVTVRNPLRETFAQVTRALRTHHDTGVPVVELTLAPRADFDDDGVDDDDERAAGTNPYGP